jgi:hypothetical protein
MSVCLCKPFSILAAQYHLSPTKGAKEMNARLYFLSHSLLRLMLVALMWLGLFSGNPAKAQTTTYLFVTSAGYNAVDNSVKRYDAQTGTYMDDFIPSDSGGLSVPVGFVFSAGAAVSGTVTLKGCQNSAQTLTITFRPTDGSSNVDKTVTLAAA